MPEDSSLVLTRAKTMSDKMRAYKVIVDGTEVGRIKEGEEASYKLDSGSHNLLIKIDWTSSPPVSFDLAPGEQVRFECKGPANPLVGIGKMIASRGKYISLERTNF
jgi:hypothetical protein